MPDTHILDILWNYLRFFLKLKNESLNRVYLERLIRCYEKHFFFTKKFLYSMFLQLFRYWNKRMLIGKFLFMQIPDNYLDNFPKILLLHLTSSNFFMWEMEWFKIVILICDGVWKLRSVSVLEPGNINLPASCLLLHKIFS